MYLPRVVIYFGLALEYGFGRIWFVKRDWKRFCWKFGRDAVGSNGTRPPVEVFRRMVNERIIRGVAMLYFKGGSRVQLAD